MPPKETILFSLKSYRFSSNEMELSKIRFIISMAIFGTIGLFVRMIPFPSSVISMLRGLLGSAFLAVYLVISKKGFDFGAVKKNILNLTLSGALIGFNWILLFESYKYTSVAKATLCYYMAPIFIVIVSPFVFGERITLKKVVCISLSFVGMLLISGLLGNVKIEKTETKGILFGLLSAVLYAVIIVLNKKLKSIGAYERTVVQLFTCAAVMFLYALINGDIFKMSFAPTGIAVMLLVCILHTGVAYLLYFGSMEKIKAQSIAILSFTDPVVAVLISFFILGEPMGIYGFIGSVLIIGSAVFC